MRARLVHREELRRPALECAPWLLGKLICRGDVVLRITEIEAYCGPADTAAHTSKGRTPRNEPMWGEPGHAYIYLCYGIHNLVNVVCADVGEGEACLVRSCEVLEGLETVTVRRGGRRGPVLLTGPGKVGQALGLTTALSGHDLLTAGELELRDALPVRDILAGPRVGVDYASAEHREAPWRFAVAGTRWVSVATTLRPLSRT